RFPPIFTGCDAFAPLVDFCPFARDRRVYVGSRQEKVWKPNASRSGGASEYLTGATPSSPEVRGAPDPFHKDRGVVWCSPESKPGLTFPTGAVTARGGPLFSAAPNARDKLS